MPELIVMIKFGASGNFGIWAESLKKGEDKGWKNTTSRILPNNIVASVEKWVIREKLFNAAWLQDGWFPLRDTKAIITEIAGITR